MGRTCRRFRYGRVRQPFEQGIDPGPGRAQARAKRVALLGQLVNLLAEQGVGALQLLVAQKEPLDTFGDLVEMGWVRHGSVNCRVCTVLARRILGVGARGVVHTLQFNGKQEGVKAIRIRSDGSEAAETFNLRCPRNGKRTNAAPQIQT